MVGSEESEGDDLIWITVEEVAGGNSQPPAVQREEEGAGRKRKRGMEGNRERIQDEEEKVEMEPANMFHRQEHGEIKLRTGSSDPGGQS